VGGDRPVILGICGRGCQWIVVARTVQEKFLSVSLSRVRYPLASFRLPAQPVSRMTDRRQVRQHRKQSKSKGDADEGKRDPCRQGVGLAFEEEAVQLQIEDKQKRHARSRIMLSELERMQ